MIYEGKCPEGLKIRNRLSMNNLKGLTGSEQRTYEREGGGR